MANIAKSQEQQVNLVHQQQKMETARDARFGHLEAMMKVIVQGVHNQEGSSPDLPPKNLDPHISNNIGAQGNVVM